MCKSNCGGAGCAASKVLWALLIIGGLNWGLVGAFDWNLVTAIFGSVEWLESLIYILVGVSALVVLAGGCKCKACKKEGSGCCGGKKRDNMDEPKEDM